jgi:hypothetical protein
MGECKSGQFMDNMVVTHGALICYGGYGNERCKFLKDCLKDNYSNLNGKCKKLLKELES